MSATEPVEVCVIGGGVAAAVLAFELARSGLEVLIVEAGPRHDIANRYEYMKKKLYAVDPWSSSNPERDQYTLGGSYRYPLNALRVKAVGGSGLHWGGQVDRLHESDFELHSRYGIGVDWPIRYRDLEPYYTQAEKLIGVAGVDSSPWSPWRSEKYPMPPFPFSYSDQIWKVAFDRHGIPLHHAAVARTSVPYDGRPACMSFSMCETCPIFAKWTPDLLMSKAEKTGKVIVKTDSRVTRINRNKTDATIESVTVVSIVNGQFVHATHQAKVFVLAAHAVESSRLLLLSAGKSDPHGLGNNSRCVGKYFSDHPGIIMTAELKEKTYPERIGFETSVSYYFYESNRQAGGNAFVLNPHNRHVRSPLEIVNEELQKDIVWGDQLRTKVHNQFGYTVSIGAQIEQLPYEENCITLDKHITDDLGLPVPKVTYSFEQKRELRTMEKAMTVIRKLFEILDAREIRLKRIASFAHHMGTCRMGDDPESSVVDRHLKVHDIDNLYIVGSSVFPTFGAIWPTLTIAALALRLAGYITEKSRKDRRVPATNGADA